MKYLLDTHSLLWITIDSKNISKRVKKIFLDKENEIYFSTVSIWEMAIKISLNKLSITPDLSDFIDEHVIGNTIQILHITPLHIFPFETLPFHHRDPFDRLLLSQCIVEKMPIVSREKVFDKYPVKRVW